MAVNRFNYFSKNNNIKYCGSSQIKQFSKCPAKALAMLKGEWSDEDSTALLVGSYVDAWFEGTLEDFKKNHPSIFKKDGTLKSDYIQAESIIERVSQDEMFMKYMSGRKQVIRVGSIDGIPIKIKIDSYHKKAAIVDLKIVKDMKPIYDEEVGSYVDFIHYWMYDRQGALYQQIVEQLTGEKLPFILCVATKEKYTDFAVIRIPQEWLDSALVDIRTRLPLIDAYKKDILEAPRCEKCNYCRSTKRLSRVISANELIPNFDS